MILLKIKKSTKLKLIVIVINIHFDDYGQYSGRQSSRDEGDEIGEMTSVNVEPWCQLMQTGTHMLTDFILVPILWS